MHDSNVCNLDVETITKKSLSKGFSIGCRSFKLLTGFGLNKLANLDRYAVKDLKIMALKAAQILKKRMLDIPNIDSLSNEIAASRQTGKQVMPLSMEVVVNSFISTQSKIFTDLFYRNDLAVGQLRQRFPASEFTSVKINFAKIIDNNKHVDDVINKFHFRPLYRIIEVFGLALLSAIRSFFVLSARKLTQHVKANLKN